MDNNIQRPRLKAQGAQTSTGGLFNEPGELPPWHVIDALLRHIRPALAILRSENARKLLPENARVVWTRKLEAIDKHAKEVGLG